MVVASDASLKSLSPLERARMSAVIELPEQIQNITCLHPAEGAPSSALGYVEELKKRFANIFGQPFLHFEQGVPTERKAKKVCVVLSGGQASGGHNVIAGLFDALKVYHGDSKLLGFLDGPMGLIKNNYKEIQEEELRYFRQQGGFHLIGSGRTKIETPEQFEAVRATVEAHDLDAVVIIGGDDSNTNAALLADYFLKNNCKTQVIGVPKTIDGDLKNEHIEVSFGFDTATKTYAELIGNIQKDAISAKKYVHFIRLMGRDASHVTLECALQTHPNMTLISEERKSLTQIINEIADMLCERAKLGKNYGVILIPEGILGFIPEMKDLIAMLDDLVGSGKFRDVPQLSERVVLARESLHKNSADLLACFDSLPAEIQEKLLGDRDEHGNMQVSAIETEGLISSAVKKELEKRKKEGKYLGEFEAEHHDFIPQETPDLKPQKHSYGYEGRACLPSPFDSKYCHSLGYAVALLIESGKTAYMAAIKNLHLPVHEWQVMGVPLTSMMSIERRKGEPKAVISKTLVDLKGKPYLTLKAEEEKWRLNDDYISPGPIQFFGPPEISDLRSHTLLLERA